MKWYENFFDEVYLSFLEEMIPKGEKEAFLIDALLRFYGKMLRRKFSKILDCGCGIGRHAIPLAKLGYKVSGIDSSEAYIKYAKEWARKEKLKIDFRVADMRNLPFQANSFDVILSLFTTFGYFSEEENLKVLKEFRRVLKKEALILLDVPNRNAIKSIFLPLHCQEVEKFLAIIRTKQIGRRWVDEWWIYEKVGNNLKFVCKKVSKVRLYTREELENLAKKANLKVIDFLSGFSLAPFEESSRRILAILGT